MQKIYKYILTSIFVICANFLQAQNNEVISIIKKEVDRNMANLKIDKLKPPFFINYNMVDVTHLSIAATLGSIIRSNSNHYRRGIPTLLVGDYNRNNSNFSNFKYIYDVKAITLDNESIPYLMWLGLDNVYKISAENYEAKVAAIAQQNFEQEELELPDFEETPATVLTIEHVKMNLDKAYWENYAKKASEVFKKYPQILNSHIDVYIRDATLYTYNTENTEIVMPLPYYKLYLLISGIAGDGQEIWREMYIEHSTFEQMPDLKKIIDTCEIAAKQLVATLEAPMITEAYSGPVLFEGQAAPEITQMVVSNLIAARKPVAGNEDGNNLEMMKDKKLIARILSLTSMSGTETYNGKKLDGYYPIDAEGVAPDKELTLIENGVLKNMLNGRNPTKKFRHSNGHKRFSVGNNMTSTMPGNIRLTSKITSSDMKQKLLEAAKEEDIDYAYIVRGYYGGAPFDVYRVYVADGREELVRGAVLQDFNIKSFKRVTGTSDREIIYNTTFFGDFTTYIVPDAILFGELEITKDNNITLKTPFIAPAPQLK